MRRQRIYIVTGGRPGARVGFSKVVVLVVVGVGLEGVISEWELQGKLRKRYLHFRGRRTGWIIKVACCLMVDSGMTVSDERGVRRRGRFSRFCRAGKPSAQQHGLEEGGGGWGGSGRRRAQLVRNLEWKMEVASCIVFFVVVVGDMV